MSNLKIVGRGVDTLILNICYAGTNGKQIKKELAADLQAELSRLQDEARTTETAVVTTWAFKGFHIYIQPKGSRGHTYLPSGQSSHLSWAALFLGASERGENVKGLFYCVLLPGALVSGLVLGLLV